MRLTAEIPVRRRTCPIAFATWAIASSIATAQAVRTESISPTATDAAITQWTSPHYVAFDTAATPRGLLFVYMHGQGGAGGGASELLKTAASERFHAVGITYPNDWAPFSFCSSGTDADCYENLRREILDGTDRSPHIAVNRTNSFENRLIKLLVHLDGLHAGEGWGSFLSGDQPAWNRIVVWGHSQGGSNAAMLAKHHAVVRLIMSGQPSDAVPGGFAAWWNTHATPSAAYFGFCHTQDQLSAKVAVWNILGMGPFGGVQDVATVPSPYANTHELSTSVAPAVAGQYHNSVTQDSVTPRDGQGEPVYRPVWRYLIAVPSAIGDMNCDGSVDALDVGPMVLALVDSDAYHTAFPVCDLLHADANSDSQPNGADIHAFVALLLGP